MARTVAVIQAQIDALKAAIGSGVLLVQHGADKTQYQDFNSMRKALALLESELDEVNETTPRSRVNYIEQRSKGFGCGPGPSVGADFTESE